jgi:acid phosphatase
MKFHPALSPLTLAVGAALAVHGGQALAATSVTGLVVGTGDYQNAKVCLDANANGRCDSGEVFAMTDATGAFTLKSSALAVPLVAEITKTTTLFDPVTATSSGVTRPLVFRAPASLTRHVVISPVTTELQSLADSEKGNLSGASTELAARIGVKPAQLFANPLTLGDTAAQALLLTESAQLLDRIAYAYKEAGDSDSRVLALRNRLALDKITNIVFIYAENRSFDNLYAAFPGATKPGSLPAQQPPQLDRDGVTVLPVLPPAWNGMTAAGQTPVITQAQTTNVWPNAPFQIDAATDQFGYGTLPNSIVTRDLYHRFFENAMQIDGGKNDQFAAWGDSGGLVMGRFDGSKTQLWNIAQQYALADHFFQGAYGGSFLNHQYLICACAPSIPVAEVASNGVSVNVLTTPRNGVPQLAANASQTASALDGPPSLRTGNVAPLDYFGAGDGYRAVNTMQAAYQPSGNKPADHNGNDPLYSNTAASTYVPPQTQTNIGDLLSQKSITWAWYSGGWDAASANPYPYDPNTNTYGTSTTIYNANSFGTADSLHTDFQAHHQPFNYYATMDPVAHAAYRAQHLKDRDDLLAQAQAGTLPAVAFYKPVGFLNQHPGYASETDGDAEIAGVIQTLQRSPQWKHMLVVVTYDEFGGQYDRVAPPQGDLLGPGTRIPALIVSPYVRKGFVDHSPYDTASILRFITHRYSLPVLNGLQQRDAAVMASTGKPISDLTNALDFTQDFAQKH